MHGKIRGKDQKGREREKECSMYMDVAYVLYFETIPVAADVCHIWEDSNAPKIGISCERCVSLWCDR